MSRGRNRTRTSVVSVTPLRSIIKHYYQIEFIMLLSYDVPKLVVVLNVTIMSYARND